MKQYLCIWMFTLATTLFATIASAQADDTKKDGEESDKPTQEQLIKNLEKTLTGSKLIGQFTVTGKDDKPPAKEEYVITLAQKVPEGDLWLIKAKFNNQTYPIPLEIKWAGDTPIITLTNLTIGNQKYSSRVVIYEGRYAGTWQHNEVGGHLFGTIERAEDTKKAEK